MVPTKHWPPSSDHFLTILPFTGCNLGSEKFWLLGRNSLRWEGVQPKQRNLRHSQYIYRGDRE